MLKSKRESWQAPRRTDWNKVSWILAGIAIVALIAGLVWVLTRPAPPAPPAPPPPPTAHALTALENTGMQAVLTRYKGAGAYSMNGQITVGKNTFGIQLSTIADGSAGTGTLTAGGTRGDMLLDGGAVYLRGDSAFWSALGVTGAPPAAPGWAKVGPDFMDGKLFYPAAKWTSALAPTAQSMIDGNKYTSGGASAVIGGDGIAELELPGILKAKIGAATAAQVNDVARPLIDQRGAFAEVNRSAGGRWTLPAPEPATPETSTTPTP